MPKLSDRSTNYLNKEIVKKVSGKIGDYQQIAAMLAIFEIMSNGHFRDLLRYVSIYSKIGALKSFTKDKRIAKPVTKLYHHMARKRFLWVLEDTVNAHAKLSACYIYAVTEIFNKLKKRALDDESILSAPEVRNHPKLISAMLGAADIDHRLKKWRKYCDKKNISSEEQDKIWDYFRKNEIDLRRLCVLGRNQEINVEQRIQECDKICQFFKRDKATSAFLENVTKSTFMKKGGKWFFNPSTVGWVAAVTTGLFTAAILAWVISAITPIIISISPFILVPITAIVSIAVLTCLPMLVKTFASWCATKFDDFKQDNYEDKLEASSVNYAKIVADYRDKSLKTLPESEVRKAAADGGAHYTKLDDEPAIHELVPVFA